ALVLSPESRRWLTGFTGSNGQVVVDAARIILLTDGRYRAQAAEQAGPHVDDIVIYEAFEDAAAASRVRSVRGEGPAMTVDHWPRWSRRLPAARFHDATAMYLGLRAIKDGGELGAIRKAVQRAEDAWRADAPTIAAGCIERELALDLEW